MDELIQYFSLHHDHFLYALAAIFLLLELSVLGMSGPLLFVALACVLTGVMVSLHIINGLTVEIFSVGILAALSALLLWKPLKKFQNAEVGRDTSSDMVGRDLPVTFTITYDEGRVFYSGIEWQARLDVAHPQPILVGARALVVGVDGSRLIVAPH